jgi:hypothetical protein
MNPIELESIQFSELENEDSKFKESEDKVFIRLIIGDYYCYKAYRERDLKKKNQLFSFANRFYNSSSIISKEHLSPNNSWTLMIAL